MRRRTYLASVAGLAATGGCLGTVSAVLPGSGRDAPSPPARCPSFDERAETVCVGDDDASASFSRSAASVGDGEEFVVTLTNESAEAVGLNPYAWTVYRRDGDGWTQVAPDAFVEPWRRLEAGASQSWRLQVGDASGETSADAVVIDPLGLERGEHAFTVLAVVDGDRTEFVAPFAVA